LLVLRLQRCERLASRSAAGRLGGLHQRRQLLFKVRQRQHCSKRRDVAGVERSAQLHAQLRSSVRRGGGHVDVQRAACVEEALQERNGCHTAATQGRTCYGTPRAEHRRWFERACSNRS